MRMSIALRARLIAYFHLRSALNTGEPVEWAGDVCSGHRGGDLHGSGLAAYLCPGALSPTRRRCERASAGLWQHADRAVMDDHSHTYYLRAVSWHRARTVLSAGCAQATERSECCGDRTPV